jgi:hypothetical protein
MKGKFWVGTVVGAVAGMCLLDGSMRVKDVFKKGKKKVTDQIEMPY